LPGRTDGHAWRHSRQSLRRRIPSRFIARPCSRQPQLQPPRRWTRPAPPPSTPL